MKTLQEFRDCKKKKIKINKSNHYIDYENIDIEHVIVYNDHVEIAKLNNGKHHLVLERSEYEGGLKELEEILWDWLKWELQTATSDMYIDLDIRAKELLDSINETCSLDEVELRKYDIITIDKISYLLKQYNEL